MRYSLWADNTFIQTSNDPLKLTCNGSQLQAWWIGVAGDKPLPTTTLRIEDNLKQMPVYVAENRPRCMLRWKPCVASALKPTPESIIRAELEGLCNDLKERLTADFLGVENTPLTQDKIKKVIENHELYKRYNATHDYTVFKRLRVMCTASINDKVIANEFFL
jgi:hypothetical protein